MASVNWLLVGPGDIARKRVAPALAAVPDSRLASIVYHSNRQAAEELADTYNADQIYDNLEQALAESDANAVYLATPVNLHVPQALEVLRSGRHVLIEKPLSLTADEAQPLVDLAAEQKLQAGCAYYRRFFPRVAHARELLAAGDLGTPVLVRLIYHSWFDPAPDDPKYWRTRTDKAAAGALADMGSHLLDLMVALVGEPETIYGRCDNLLHPDWSVEDSCSALLTLPGGCQVTASFSWNSKTWRQEVEIVGSEGRINWLPSDNGPIQITRGRDIETLASDNADNVHTPLVADFVCSVRDRRPPAIPVAEAQKASRIIDGIQRSSAEGRPVTYAELLP